MALSLSAEGITYVKPHEWDVSVSYRFLHSENIYVGDTERTDLTNPNGPRLDVHSVDVLLTYAFTPRFSATVVLPFVHSDLSSVRDHADGMRHETSAGGLGDVRLVGNGWLFNPETSPNGNISIGVGFKAPTGDDRVVDNYYTLTGVQLRPVDISGQPGDGGWGLVPEMQAFQRIFTNTFLYASGSYLMNPQEQNHTPAAYDRGGRLPAGGPNKAGPHEQFNSVPDQYLARAGVQQTIWPEKGLALSLGGRIDGLPVHDAIGGDNGFRRPGYSVYLEPGVNWVHGDWTLTLSGPVALYHNRPASVPESEAGINRGGGFADFLILASVTKRF